MATAKDTFYVLYAQSLLNHATRILSWKNDDKEVAEILGLAYTVAKKVTRTIFLYS